MVLVKIIGGLGNQMFQYAVARRLAWFLNVPLKLDICSCNAYRDWAYGLKHFKIAAEFASEEEIIWLKCLNHIQEKQFHFDPTILSLSSDVYLDGYWQSEKYFKDIDPIIRQEFTLKKEPDAKNAALAQKIAETEAVSVHVRRGDYVTNPVVNYLHGLCPLEYYHQAITRLISQVEKPHFYVFSDDWEWVKNNMILGYPTTFVMINGPEKAYEDLRLMSLCRYHIIANSSFSWWGAWLSNYQYKLVFAPRKWFHGYQHDTRDLIPNGWEYV
jgi:hypothetical protein